MLDTAGLKQAIAAALQANIPVVPKDAPDEVKKSLQASIDKAKEQAKAQAEAIANAIESFVKSGEVEVTAETGKIVVAGSATTQQNAAPIKIKGVVK
ncbi:MAG TPA: hypothetical protein VHO03_17000 [Ignavibacteriales bacterium]|nr:hypothetical protein [Ignavibacteriales bacterium]